MMMMEPKLFEKHAKLQPNIESTLCGQAGLMRCMTCGVCIGAQRMRWAQYRI